jgi:D-alanyl-D-alanine endopeptidase (penicillin-binding protein 7)
MTETTTRRWRRWVTGIVTVAVVCAGVVSESAGQTKASSSAKKPAPRSTKSATPARDNAGAAKKKTTTYSRTRASARRAALARARAAQRAKEAREVAQPRFKLGEDGSIVPDVRAAAAIIYNPATHEVLWEEHGDETRSIASITKVMTAVVFLENEFDLTRLVQVDPRDTRRASTTYLRSRERVRLDDLLHLTLVASDNVAARTLARSSPFGYEGFIYRMNLKAAELGLTQTHYADPSGLLSDNVSTARDMARLIAYAASDPRVSEVMRKADYTFRTSRRTLTVRNTNKLVGTEVDVQGGKTGYITRSGYCLATLLKLPQSDQQVAVVVLGAKSNAGRFMETRHLFNWIAGKMPFFGTSEPQTPEPQIQQLP